MTGKILALLAASFVLARSEIAQADVTISNKPTSNMSCEAGVCAATARKAVLNVADLQNMLANGDVAVKTGTVANDIEITQPLTWSSTSRLTLDAQASITVKKPVTVTGSGGLTIAYDNQSGSNDLYFFGKGQVTFSDMASSLVINGQSFTLNADLPSLADAMNGNEGGSFALANDYDAKNDSFKHSPVDYFEGNFEGLGHSISHLKLRGGGHQRAGMFAKTGQAIIRDIYLKQVNVRSGNKLYVGALVGDNGAQIVNASVTGTVIGNSDFAAVGALIGANGGLIDRSRSNATVAGHGAGGLVGGNIGVVYRCYSNSTVSGSSAGGLTGSNDGHVFDAYAAGSVTGSDLAGGLVAGTGGSQSVVGAYSTGGVSGLTTGGLVGTDFNLTVSDSYWDLDTSGIADPGQGAGQPADDPGITGLTDAQLKSGLPKDFDPKIWGSNPNINGGYPYLRANPPQ